MTRHGYAPAWRNRRAGWRLLARPRRRAEAEIIAEISARLRDQWGGMIGVGSCDTLALAVRIPLTVRITTPINPVTLTRRTP